MHGPSPDVLLSLPARHCTRKRDRAGGVLTLAQSWARAESEPLPRHGGPPVILIPSTYSVFRSDLSHPISLRRSLALSLGLFRVSPSLSLVPTLWIVPRSRLQALGISLAGSRINLASSPRCSFLPSHTATPTHLPLPTSRLAPCSSHLPFHRPPPTAHVPPSTFHVPPSDSP